ncbi:thrombospondin type 3 repeat-containing protein [Catellatospora sp. NPDC049609]|uniref:thrombospondin type 3 repeat-containing protein n=1 Tax=Catellatospora sp. NPDC049609 TaxID=3155505 RepID=UPI00341FCBBB
MMQKLFRACTAAVVFVALTAGVAAPARAVEEQSQKYSTLRLCDASACYVVWSVVDSDHDGVCDADELRAGTDPHDPASRPGLKLIAELLTARELPSFEYGLASLVVFPAEIMKAREELGVDLLGAFPVHKRADALTRLGISGDQLSKFGISPEHSGFALGLEGLGSADTPAGVRVSGIEVGLISGGAKDPTKHVFGGGVVDTDKNWRGDTVRIYADGSKETVTPIKDGVSIEITDKSGDKVGTTVKHGYSVKEGTTEVVFQDVKVLDSSDNLVLSTSMEYVKEADGSETTYTVTTEYVRDDDGNLLGTKTTETTEYTSGDKSRHSTTTTTTVCDASGTQCTSKTQYMDPEQAYHAMVTQEMVDGALRLRGAAINVVPGWNAPGMEEQPEDPRNPTTIMLVDGTVGELFMLTEPKRVTTAQPEGRPDLPSPQHAGPLPAGGCDGLC